MMKPIVGCILGVAVLAACEQRRCPDGPPSEAAPTTSAALYLAKMRITFRVANTDGPRTGVDDVPDGPVVVQDPGLKCEVSPGMGSEGKGARSVYCYRGRATSFMHFHCPEDSRTEEIELGMLVLDGDRGKSAPHSFHAVCLYR